jgi:hypothetical protein
MVGVSVMQRNSFAVMVTLGSCTVTSALSTRDSVLHAGSKDKWIKVTHRCGVRSILFD